MIERYLTRDEVAMCKAAGAASAGMVKSAALPAFLTALWSALKGAAHVGLGAAKAVPATVDFTLGTALKSMGLGVGGGVLLGAGYDAIKENLTREDPEEKLEDSKLALIESRKRELEDSMWMAKARRLRDDLRKNYKKMDPRTYAAEYARLEGLLNERSA